MVGGIGDGPREHELPVPGHALRLERVDAAPGLVDGDDLSARTDHVGDRPDVAGSERGEHVVDAGGGERRHLAGEVTANDVVGPHLTHPLRRLRARGHGDDLETREGLRELDDQRADAPCRADHQEHSRAFAGERQAVEQALPRGDDHQRQCGRLCDRQRARSMADDVLVHQVEPRVRARAIDLPGVEHAIPHGEAGQLLADGDHDLCRVVAETCHHRADDTRRACGPSRHSAIPSGT